MKQHRRLLLAAALLAGITPAVAQQFPTVPDHTVIGRIGTGSGSGASQAIPFTSLSAQITGNAFITFAGPTTPIKTFTLPNASVTLAALSVIQTWTGAQSFTDGTLILLGSSSGSSTIKAPATGGGTATLFPGSDTITGIAASQTLTNKTLTSPTLTTPSLGVATATSVNKVAITAPATSATLTLTDGTTLTGPAASGTAMTLGNNETVTGVKTFGAAGNVGKLVVAGTTSGTTVVNATATASGTLTLPAATDTLVGKATTDILTNKTFDSAGTGNALSVSGVAVSRGQFPGTSTNDSATAGNIGEYATAVNVVSGSAQALTTNTPLNLGSTSISLTAGDWDVWCHLLFTPAGTTNITVLVASLSTTSATLNTAPTNFSQFAYPGSVLGATNTMVPDVRTRVSVSATTPVFCVAQATFTVAGLSVWGSLQARRLR